MRTENRVLAIELKLCPVMDAPTADFKGTRKAPDVQQDGMTPVARLGRKIQLAVRVPELGRSWRAVQNSRKEN